MSPDRRRPGYIEHHRRHLDSEDRYHRTRRRWNAFLIVWLIVWIAAAALALILL